MTVTGIGRDNHERICATMVKTLRSDNSPQLLSENTGATGNVFLQCLRHSIMMAMA
jgi:hypothetical protein